MRIHIVTVLPTLFDSFLEQGLFGKAIAKGILETTVLSPRAFTHDRHQSVDDGPYGGGSGMVMKPTPIIDAVEQLERQSVDAGRGRPLRVLLSAQGERFSQPLARELSAVPSITLVCGRYEGIDERAVQRMDRQISIGDYVLMGGEVAAMVVLEAVTRLIPGVLGNPESIVEESHSSGLLEHPHYTRPAEYRGEGIPAVLTGGNHAAIARWRRHESLRRTFERRPDLLAAAELTDDDRAFLATLERGT